VRLTGMRDDFNGATATVVELKYTRAVIELESGAGRFAAGQRVLAPMRCLEVI
jgi:hypothetical protein